MRTEVIVTRLSSDRHTIITRLNTRGSVLFNKRLQLIADQVVGRQQAASSSLAGPDLTAASPREIADRSGICKFCCGDFCRVQSPPGCSYFLTTCRLINRRRPSCQLAAKAATNTEKHRKMSGSCGCRLLPAVNSALLSADCWVFAFRLGQWGQ